MDYEDFSGKSWMEKLDVSPDARQAYSSLKGNRNFTALLDHHRSNPLDKGLVDTVSQIRTILDAEGYDADESTDMVNHILQLRANDPDLDENPKMAA